MVWTVEITKPAKKELARLDKAMANRILRYLAERIATCDDPRRFGESLAENLSGLWKYRIGDFRVIAEIVDERFIVLVIRVGHRSKVYSTR
ncbi:MAG: type II toxin-antitoxin system RelE/ParE family toxin [Desulfovibrio sp.]|nr:type II toxin-antitoxin system RelE/ParE family toxin [Desulfovibrio sp.]